MAWRISNLARKTQQVSGIAARGLLRKSMKFPEEASTEDGCREQPEKDGDGMPSREVYAEARNAS